MSSEDNVHVRFTKPAEGDKKASGEELLFHYMHGSEELGSPFLYEVAFLSPKSNLDPAALLGKTVGVELDLPESPLLPVSGHRYFHGYVTHLARQGRHGKYYAYSASIRPWLSLLGRARNCRIFQNKSIPDIIKEVFSGYTISDVKDSLTSSYAPQDYVVQYRETDLDFVTRLMAREGIYYFFVHEQGRHVLVLADSYSAHAQVKGYEKVPFHPSGGSGISIVEHIDTWHAEQEIRSGTMVLKDFNFMTPKQDLLAKRSVPNKHDNAAFRIYDYPGKYLDLPQGKTYARLRLEAVNTSQDQRVGEANVRGIAAGCLFNLIPYWKYPGFLSLQGAVTSVTDTGDGDQLDDVEFREYLVTATSFDIQGPRYESQAAVTVEEDFRCTLAAIDSHHDFRMPRDVPKPVVHGPHTATVVGDKGEDITTNPYGQVKVKFHWDRRGETTENGDGSAGTQPKTKDKDKNGNDPDSSCWVRVAQVWASSGFGGISIPRIGDEVIVDFLEGDPDRPIITGRVYNADNMPPYTLPDNKTQTGIKSRSTKGGNPQNFNELRFEDLKDNEQVYLQAEKDLKIFVKHDERHDVGHDRVKDITNDETSTIHGNRTEEVFKDEVITIHGKRTEIVDKDEKITISGARTEEVGKDEEITITGKRTEHVTLDEEVTLKANRTVDVGKAEKLIVGAGRTQNITGDDQVTVTKKLHFDAGDEIVIKTGDASITMKKDGTIILKGKDVSITASGKIDADASGDVTIKGSKVSTN
jgi:type VI secretion system secreted protein VgrG